MILWSRLRSLLLKRKLDADMAEEMRHHLELQQERNIAAGMSVSEARFAAHREFGNVGTIQQRARDQRGWLGWEELTTDLNFAIRMLAKHPGFTVAAVLTLALGTGFVTTLFTMVNGVAYGQLPFENAQRIVSIDVPVTRYDEYAERQQSCEAFAYVEPTSANLRAGNFVSRYSAAIVSVNFLDVLRARPFLGRTFMPEDGRASAPRTVLVGYDVWERELDRAESVLGKEVQVNGETYTLIGVMPKRFGFPFNQELWIPRRAHETPGGGIVFGRLKKDVSRRSASEQFSAISAGLPSLPGSSSSFTWNTDASVSGTTPQRLPATEVVPFAERSVKQALRWMLSAILCATFLVLLLACANVANLVLARAIDRKKELAVRAALGASRSRLVRQMLTESFVVALLGSMGGLAVATWSTRGLWSYMMKERPLTGGAPFWMDFDVDGRVFIFVASISLLASLLTGLVPALQASRIQLDTALKEGGRSGLRVSSLTRFLVNTQMAFSVCLVTVAGLFVTVLISFNSKVLPYDPEAIFTARVSLDERRYDDPLSRLSFFNDIVSRLAAAPGVQAVALTSSESLRIARTPRIELEGENYTRDADRPSCTAETVTPNFIEAFGVGLIAGRSLNSADSGTAPAVAIVNVPFAARYGGENSIVGRRFRLAVEGPVPGPWITVVGVTPDLGTMKAGEASRGPVIYRPLAQENVRAMTVLVRGVGDVSRFAHVIRAKVAELDPELPISRMQTIQEIIELERIGMNAFGSLFVVCGLGALLLATVGIYGVIALGVKLRTREFGVRMALGADSSNISRMVLGDGVRQISVGLIVGVFLAAGASVVLSSMFFGFGRTVFDTWIYAGVLVLLSSVGGAALLIPARRAARVDPMVALRNE